ncbi:MAG TPA: MBL fold metallo-hydrolase [Gaiellaceae bacterium]|nr:MBL fold metallo-hydrolase [Gaiellaceae bacterium]
MEHFRLEQVADDAWAAMALAETGAVGNAGFIRVADFTIVFDTFASTAAADELRLAAEVIAPVAYAINSHWHADHVNGNRSFDDLPILATERTRELMEERAIGDLDVVFPTDVFDERVEREGAVVETLGGGHTESDAFLWFEDTVFAGDLVVVETHPWVGDGDVEHWLEILEAFEARRPRVIVPGHGQIGSVGDIPPLRRYLEGLLDGTATVIDGWAFAAGHERNVEALRG